jgi:hypothetical protein
VPFLSQSYHIESNRANDVCRDAGGNPLEGIRVTEDGVIRRFHNGLLDGETMGYGILAWVGAGVNPENMHAERVAWATPSRAAGRWWS